MMEEHIVQESGNTRLDRYLTRLFPSITHGIIEKAIRKRDILVNAVTVEASYRLRDGDVIHYYKGLFKPYALSEVGFERAFSPSVNALALKIRQHYTVHDCEHFIALNKPAGLAVQNGSKIALSVDDALSYINSEQDQQYKLVHRIDKGTSGILLVAKGHYNASKLAKAFEERAIRKKYLAIVNGILPNKIGTISNHIGKVAPKSDFLELVHGSSRCSRYEIMGIVDSNTGRKAVTEYKVMQEDMIRRCSLIEYRPITGRMHQLRLHSSYLNCPIIGDVKYGGPKSERIMLHAYQVIVDRSVFGNEITVTIDPGWHL